MEAPGFSMIASKCLRSTQSGHKPLLGGFLILVQLVGTYLRALSGRRKPINVVIRRELFISLHLTPFFHFFF